ncbi:hypothetical protein ONS95_000200 [Cadophora gregata]|uniref:uncharacterized protein n=1 Tax=Cadophora gregata TaxID=51156 RepID=UPI0026DBD458|nr:uncharacterized protein ONS95_000200 [Cadophora gregata]KAK0115522.1 hypothetical protein ONS96_013975 [Cadophora gregata f. sp. sojae]KAK0128222.1 hypothetical protein ONS95_000200 [Cadophora gregata]
MELPAGVNRRYASIAIFLLASVWIWVAFDRPYTFPTHIPWNIYSNAPQTDRPSDVFDYPPLHSPSLKKLCAETSWNASVLFTCQEPTGSFAEARNSLLGCVRLAVAAGGSLVVPRIMVRDGSGNSSTNSTDMGYMFDTEHFVASLELSCPQMAIHQTEFGIADGGDGKGTVNLQPESILNLVDSAEHSGENWRPTFYKWLPKVAAEPSRPIIVRLGDCYLKYPIAKDGEAFRQHFGKILKIRADVRRFATTILQNLSEMYDEPLNLKDLMLQNILLGVYLSTEVNMDSLSEEDRGNANYEAQSKLFLGHAMRKNISLLYVASSHKPETSRFTLDANADEIVATSKLNLLKGKDLEDLLSLTIDQQAMVDFLVMTKVSEFIGMGYDSFAWSVALRRHEYLKKGTGTAWMSGHYVAKDPFSTLIGATGGHQEFASSMWP